MADENKNVKKSGRAIGCRRRFYGCLLLLALGVFALCGFLFWLFNSSQAAALETEPLIVWLLIDNSNSMFEKAGVGSDPGLLRIDAARLFFNYLGIDEPGAVHQAGVIFFGSDADTAVPLTPLIDEEQRAQLFHQIAEPKRMGWSDHLSALEQVQMELEGVDPDLQPAVILLTDGKPEIAGNPTAAERAAYSVALQRKIEELAAADIALHIILLTNEITAEDEEIVDYWRPFWQEMSGVAPSGRLYTVSQPSELPDIYHDIVVGLTGRQTDGIVLQTTVTDAITETLSISSDLAQLTLVISKGSPTQTVSIFNSLGDSLNEKQPQVRRAGGEDNDREEIWIIEHPDSGSWMVRIDGAGDVIIWQDSVPAPMRTITTTATVSPATFPAFVSLATDEPKPTPSLKPTVSPTQIPALTATKIVASATESANPDPEQGEEENLFFLWPWLVVGGATAVAGAAFFYRRRRVTGTVVTGDLRLLDGYKITGNRTVIDLETFDAARLVIGQQPADCPLPNVAVQATIRPGRALDDAYEMLVKGSEGLLLNGSPLPHEMALTDMAILDFGGVRARYENLRLRRVEREREELSIE